MSPGRNALAVRAAAIVVDARTVVRDSWLLIRGGRIADLLPVRSGPPAGRRLSFGDRVLVPGLVNAHAHLELTGFPTRKPPPRRLDLWLAQLIGNKEGWSARRAAAAVRRGVSLCLRSGTTTVGEIEGLGLSASILRSLPLRATVYREVLGLDPSVAEERLQEAKRFLARPAGGSIRRGISPHAPYSVSGKLLRKLGLLVAERDAPVAVHLAESPGELEFLREGKGPLLDLLRRKGKLPLGFRAPRVGPLRYLGRHGLVLPRLLLIHGNYLERSEIRELARRRTSVVFCPGSHQYFRYDRYPLPLLLREGVAVALGTDSLASNEALDLFREMALIRKEFPSVSARSVFEMATSQGARALGWEDRVGTLERGRDADFVVLDIRSSRLTDEEIFDRVTLGRPAVLRTFFRGRRVV